MAEIEDQVRLLADRRFARTAAVPTEQIRPTAPSPAPGLLGAKAIAKSFDDEPPNESADQTVASQSHEGDLIMVDIQTQEAGETQADEMNRRKLARRAILAAAAVVIAVIAVALFDGAEKSSEIEVVERPADIDAPEPEQLTPEPTVFGAERSMAVADAYFAANSAGDFEALQALFVADPTFTGPFGIAEDEQLFAYNVAQGTTISPPECTAVDGAVEGTMTVTCQAFNLDALVQAVDGPSVPIRLTLTITPDGIVEELGFFGQPDFNAVGEPFDEWMKANHPDEVAAIEFGKWTTIEEARRGGTVIAQYATDWATYLEANGCAFDEGC